MEDGRKGSGVGGGKEERGNVKKKKEEEEEEGRGRAQHPSQILQHVTQDGVFCSH